MRRLCESKGYGRGLPIKLIKQLNEKATKGIWPDITFLLDLAPEVALERSERSDRIEKEDLSFHRRVREGYLRLAKSHPQRIIIIEADAPLKKIHEIIKKIVWERLTCDI